MSEFATTSIDDIEAANRALDAWQAAESEAMERARREVIRAGS